METTYRIKRSLISERILRNRQKHQDLPVFSPQETQMSMACNVVRCLTPDHSWFYQRKWRRHEASSYSRVIGRVFFFFFLEEIKHRRRSTSILAEKVKAKPKNTTCKAAHEVLVEWVNSGTGVGDSSSQILFFSCHGWQMATRPRSLVKISFLSWVNFRIKKKKDGYTSRPYLELYPDVFQNLHTHIC